MKKLFIVMLLIIGTLGTEVMAQELPVAQYERPHEVELITQLTSLGSYTIEEEGASFVRVHFSKFNIPKGVIVKVSNPEGTESYTYTKFDQRFSTKKPSDGPRSFFAMSIHGNTAIVTIEGYHPNKNIGHNLVIDSVTFGLPEDEIRRLYQEYEDSFSTESTCGDVNDRKYVECYRDSFPIEFDRSRPVARISNGGGSLCTAWRVGPDNRMITNAHCNNTAAEVAASEVWFNYEYVGCAGGGLKSPIVKVPGVEMLYTKHEHDITLFTVGAFETIPQFGYLGLEPRHAVLGERIYRPGHGAGSPKQLTIESDMNASGFCEIDDESRNGYGTDSDYGYWCDSTGGSSGSPVLTPTNNRAIALHHFGGCMNAGIKTAAFWSGIAPWFNNIVPAGDDSPTNTNQSPTADLQISCIYGECSYDASGSTDPEDDPLTYKWRFGDGVESTDVSGTQIYDTTGVYSVYLEVADGNGGYGYDSEILAVTLEGENIKPVNAWSVASSNGDYTAVFTDESYDWDGEIVNWQWTVNDSGTGNFVYPLGQRELTHTFQIGGRQLAWLRVWDDFGDNKSVGKWFTVTGPIMNDSPTASFTTDVNHNIAIFTDTSTDDGHIVRWNWISVPVTPVPGFTRLVSCCDDPNPVQIFPDVIFDDADSVDMRTQLQIMDNHGATHYTNGYFTLTAPVPPTPPEADFTFSVNKLDVLFEDTSTDEGVIVSWAWDFGDGGTSTDENPSHTYAAVGTYSVELVATDNDGQTDSVTSDVTTVANVGPTAAFTYDCDTTLCSFDGTSSSDPDGDVVGYSWVFFGASDPLLGAMISKNFGVYGEFEVTLTVADEEGETDSITKMVLVPEELVLDVETQRLKKGLTSIQLSWNVVFCATPGCEVDVYLGNSTVDTTPNDGSWNSDEKLKGRHTAYICLSDGSQCSNTVQLK